MLQITQTDPPALVENTPVILCNRQIFQSREEEGKATKNHACKVAFYATPSDQDDFRSGKYL
ncbi:MAG: hypothetical protein ACLUVV_02695 [Christensenellales bacterium]